MKALIPITIALSLILPACSSKREPVLIPSRVEIIAPPKPVETSQAPNPIPIKKTAKTKKKSKSKFSVGKVLDTAVEQATIKPHLNDYDNAIVQYDFADGAIYSIYTCPLKITDIRFQVGEKISSVNTGDKVRWQITQSVSGNGKTRREHIAVKPVEPDLSTNFVIHTNKRVYYLYLTSFHESHITSVSWTYPQDDAKKATKEPPDIFATLKGKSLNFRYEIQGNAIFTPQTVFDEGIHTFIQFPPNITQHELPVFYVVSDETDTEIVNSRFLNHYLIVDRIFSKAVLRLGKKKIYIHNTSRQPPKRWWQAD